MANDHAQDRYDPPGVGSDFDEHLYGDVVKGEVFRLKPLSRDKVYRKVDEYNCHDILENQTKQFDLKLKVYVKS
jgi:hypothetical protein